MTPDTFYSSKELHKLFGYSKRLTGNSKIAFDHRLERLASFNYYPETGEYYIEEIYETPLPDVKDTKYSKLIKILLMDYLSKRPKNMEVMTRKYWWYCLNMVNRNFLKLKREPSEIPRNLDCSAMNGAFGEPPKQAIKYNLSTFYKNASSHFNKMFDRALRQLSAQSLITYHYVYLIDESGHHRIADELEEDTIRDIQHDVLEDMNIESLNRLYSYSEKKQQVFYDKCTTLYLEYGVSRDPNVRVYNNAVQIKYEQERMFNAKQREIKAAGNELNQLCVDWGLDWNAVTTKPINHKFMPVVVNYYIAAKN